MHMNSDELITQRRLFYHAFNGDAAWRIAFVLILPRRLKQMKIIDQSQKRKAVSTVTCQQSRK